MQRYSNEQYLPCSLPEILATTESKEIMQRDAPLFLNEDLYVFPLNEGFLIERQNGQFLVDSIDLLRSINGKCPNEICRSQQDIDEIEQYYHHDLIGHDVTASGKLSFPEISEKYSSLYRGKETTWFSQIPLKIELDITKRCNLRCKHCSRSADSGSTEGDLSLQDYISIIEEAAKIGIPDISFMGGEPTTCPSFIQLAAYARISGFRMLSTSTNGWLVDEKLAKDMAALFDVVQVSIHGADAETHDAIVGRSGAFERACQAVRLLKENRVPFLNISFTVMKENAQQMDEMIELASVLKASSIRFLVLFSAGRGKDLNQWNKDEKEGMAEIIRSQRERKQDSIMVDGGGFPPYRSVSNDATTYGCPAGRSLLYIDADGNARACGNLDNSIGNVRNDRIMDLWHSPLMVRLRNRPTCDCAYSKICSGGCLGNEYWSGMFGIDTTPIM